YAVFFQFFRGADVQQVNILAGFQFGGHRFDIHFDRSGSRLLLSRGRFGGRRLGGGPGGRTRPTADRENHCQNHSVHESISCSLHDRPKRPQLFRGGAETPETPAPSATTSSYGLARYLPAAPVPSPESVSPQDGAPTPLGAPFVRAR